MGFFEKLASILMTIFMFFASIFGGGGDNPSKPVDPTPEETSPEYKNVILLIGDGMGFNSVNYAVDLLGLDSYELQRAQYVGQARTKSANSSVTDSAAGGTALATGVKTNNGYIGVYPGDKNAEVSRPQNLSELALSLGKAAGVVTTDKNYGATPAAFSAHTSSRNNTEDIITQQLSTDLNLIWSYYSNTTLNMGIPSNFQLVRTAEDLQAVTSQSQSFGQFAHSIWHSYDYKDMPSLAEITAKAIDVLDDDPDGFFLMVEGAHIDKNSHNNDGAAMADAFKAFDEAAGVAFTYAQANEDTVVVVTADHETGGITYNEATGCYEYTSGNHTGADVPVYVYGCDEFIAQGEIVENTDIPIRLAKGMGARDFPKEIFVGE